MINLLINFLTILLIIFPNSILFGMGYTIATKDNFMAGLLIMNVTVAYVITMLIEYLEEYLDIKKVKFMKITIKSKYDKHNKKYYFYNAKNEKGENFGMVNYSGELMFSKNLLGLSYQYENLEDLEEDIEKYKNISQETQIIKVIEI